MAAPITIHIPHDLGRVEARRRIGSGFAGLKGQLPFGGGACSQRWEGDRLAFSVAAAGQSITGFIDVLDAAVTIEVALPGVLGMIAGALKGRLQKAGQRLLTRR
jgi:hypothetical protein